MNFNRNVVGIYHDYSDEGVLSLLRKSVKTELLKAKNVEDPVTLSEAFAFEHYGANWTSNSLKAAGKHFKVFAAFLHRNLLPQIPLMSLAEKTSGFMERYIITRNNSYLANLPLDTGRAVADNLFVKIRGRIKFLYLGLRFVVNMVSRRLFKVAMFKIPYFTDYATWLRGPHRD